MAKCTKRHYTQPQAVAACRHYQKNGSTPMRAYKCSSCWRPDGSRPWHIGHAIPRALRHGGGRRRTKGR